MTIKERYAHCIAYFKKHMPNPQTELAYETPFQLLVSVILSAQCTDKRVNMVTPNLFRAFPDAEHMSKATFDELFPYISSISYPNNKTKHLIGMAQMLLNDFGGEIPESVKEMQKLPGVGRKTANVIASVLYGQSTFAVDTHVFRVSQRIGLATPSKTPLEVEKKLLRYTPEADVPNMHHWLILHGRYTCVARSPKCEKCGIQAYCKYFSKKQSKANA